MKTNGKKSHSWEGITPEQKAARLAKSSQTRKQKEIRKAAAVNQEALRQFYHRPEWMAKFDDKDRKLAADFLRDALKQSREAWWKSQKQVSNLIEQGELSKASKIIKNDQQHLHREWAAEHLLELIDGLGANCISISDFMKGIRINSENQIPDLSQISRIN